MAFSKYGTTAIRLSQLIIVLLFSKPSQSLTFTNHHHGKLGIYGTTHSSPLQWRYQQQGLMTSSLARRHASSSSESSPTEPPPPEPPLPPSSKERSLENDVFFGGDEFNEDTLIAQQKYVSDSYNSPVDDDGTDKTSYTNKQRDTFDEMSSYFASDEALPPQIIPVVKFLTRRFISDVSALTSAGNDDDTPSPPRPLKILDVGCGTGVLFEYLLNEADDKELQLNLVALDLSPKMAERATDKARTILKGEASTTVWRKEHDIEVRVGDIAEMELDDDEEGYDGIIINACFGNFYDHDAVLNTLSTLLKTNGLLSITHPLGSSFVQKLHTEDPSTVRHPLPSLPSFRSLLRFKPFTMTDFIEERDIITSSGEVQHYDVYYASAKRVPHRALTQLLRFRGPVAQGYGRGGKTLGVPTANLAEEGFEEALQDVQTGVYFGWAVIEQGGGNETNVVAWKPGRNVYHKAVVNVGYSPTFVGEENKRKIIEAHLILNEEDKATIGDFYNETMRLALSGFLRPERKFPSFPELVAQIHYDIDCARDALAEQPFAAFRTDTFLVDPCRRVNRTDAVWVGQNGGDTNASWEFVDQEEVLEQIPLGRFL